jgi:ribose 1,5-bisphosphate isomerase
MEQVNDTVEKIRTLEIKGTRNIAIAAIKALQTLVQQTSAENKSQLLTELTQAHQLFFNVRKTEPLMRNALNYLKQQIQQSNIQKVPNLCTMLVMSADKFLSELDASQEQAAKIGAQLIQNETTIFTHCNSSTVIQMLIKAKQTGKKFKVICTETRPALQGRITARELSENDIETTFIVDSATQAFLFKADFAIVGADVISPKGDIVNKVGTSGLAVLAHEAHKPFYVISELLKFDPITLYKEFEDIEQRDPNEVWKEAPKNIKIQNPAFDITPIRYINGLICEKGIISPQNVFNTVQQFYPWIFK